MLGPALQLSVLLRNAFLSLAVQPIKGIAVKCFFTANQGSELGFCSYKHSRYELGFCAHENCSYDFGFCGHVHYHYERCFNPLQDDGDRLACNLLVKKVDAVDTRWRDAVFLPSMKMR